MRMVRITIEYDMDDEEKTLEAELQDWYDRRVHVDDLIDTKWMPGARGQIEGDRKVWIEPVREYEE